RRRHTRFSRGLEFRRVLFRSAVMSARSHDNAINNGKLTRALIYTALLLFAFYYLLPLYVMLVNSFKPLDEIRQGGMLNLPQQWKIGRASCRERVEIAGMARSA